MSGYVVGLTGGIGSGKSTAANHFAALGIVVVDTDEIAHELTTSGGAAMAALRDVFGGEVVAPDGSLDRAAMRRRILADAAERARLEAILHPAIREISSARCAAAQSPYVLLVVPLLVESNSYRERCDRVVVVDCDEAIQVARVMARSGLSEGDARGFLAAQASRELRLAIADDVIHNDGSLSDLAREVGELHRCFLEKAAQKAQASC